MAYKVTLTKKDGTKIYYGLKSCSVLENINPTKKVVFFSTVAKYLQASPMAL